MRFTLDRQMRPGERIRISVDFTNDMAAGDTVASSSCAAATQTEPNVDLTSANLAAQGNVGAVVGVTVTMPPVNKDLIVLFQLTTAAVAGAATITVAGTLSAISGAVGATNTFTVKVTITKGSGSSANHTCLCYGRLLNANATGITIA